MNITKEIKKKVYPSKDYIFHTIKINNNEIEYMYNETLIDSKKIAEQILFPLIHQKENTIKNLKNCLSNNNILRISKEEIIKYLNQGFMIIIYNSIYACEVRSSLDRGINTIQSELSLTGPKDSFTETFNTNLGLIRKRIKSESLKWKEVEIGEYTKTKTGILYIEGIVKNNLIKHIEKKLKKITIDGILDSSYLKASLEKKHQLFPTIMMSERPDKCSMALLEGKAVILVDNSPFAIILPSFFFDYFHTTDDYYQKSIHASFIRVIRLLAFFIAIYTPAIYLSVTTRNYSLVPIELLYMLKAGRTFVPFPAYIEALFMIICFEILKESDLRMSTTSGSAISILGGLILGDAAVAAGIVSPIMIIIIAISSISGLIFPSIELGNALRTYKIFFLILATLFGIYGVIFGSIVLLYNLATTEVFGYNYLTLDKNEIKDTILKIDSKIRKRNSKLTNNIIRGKYQ